MFISTESSLLKSIGIITVISFFLTYSSFGQDTIYFDTSWVKVKKNYAAFFRTIVPYETKYQVEDYFISGQLQMKGYSSSKDSIIKDGYFEYYTSKGIIKMKINYKNDIADGVYELFYPDGILKERGIYKNDLLIGKNTQYFQNGKLKREAEFIDGKYNGRMIYYNDKGIKIGEGICVDDGWDGKWIKYDANGDTISELFYGKNLAIEELKIQFSSPNYIWQLMVSEETQEFKRFELKCISPITNRKNIMNTPPIVSVLYSKKNDGFENFYKEFPDKQQLDIKISDSSVQLIDSYLITYLSKNNTKNELIVLKLKRDNKKFLIEYILKESENPNNKNIALELINSIKSN